MDKRLILTVAVVGVVSFLALRTIVDAYCSTYDCKQAQWQERMKGNCSSCIMQMGPSAVEQCFTDCENGVEYWNVKYLYTNSSNTS